jgi:DegV family protein with EDD domain
MNVHIVTDSSAHGQLPPNVTVVPHTIALAGKSFREGVDMSAEESLRLISRQPFAPTVQVPTQADFLAVYDRLSREYDAIISIHASREILPCWQNARAAAQAVMGRCQLDVIDSRTISAGLGMLVRMAARTLAEGASADETVRVLRGAIERIYSVFYVETTDFLMQNQIMSPSHSILGMMLNLKPVLTVEEGRLVPMEKVRTRIQAIERLVEFAVEFEEFDDALIVQNRSGLTDSSRMLSDRLATEFPDRRFPATLYGASLGALIGADATGLVILESEESDGIPRLAAADGAFDPGMTDDFSVDDDPGIDDLIDGDSESDSDYTL